MTLSVPFDPERERAELEEYLGERFELARLRRWREQLDEEFARAGDEAAFYRSSEGYLYNLTAFAMTGTKRPYLEELARALPPPARVLDYGCGIGSDGLVLAEAGYEVAFADFDNPSTRYLRWRLARRGLEADVHDLDRHAPAGFDLAFAFDVIEHVDEPFRFLALMEQAAERVMVNLLEHDPGDTALHHELPLKALLGHVAGRRGLRYRRFHGGRAHLVIYESAPARGLAALRSRAALMRGRL